jgi:hypothetical protein
MRCWRCVQRPARVKDVRWRDLQLMTISGVVKLRVRHGYSSVLGEWVCPARQVWGLKAINASVRNSRAGWLTRPAKRLRMRRQPKWQPVGAAL